MTKLYTDTSANLPLALLREYDIAVIPFSYTVNGVAEDYSEETDFDGKAFYDAMRRGAEVKTSMVNPATAAAFFERALAQGDDVLYVGMSGGISGTAHAAALAAEELRENGYVTGRPYLGISYYAVTDAQTAAQLGVNAYGVYIVEVVKGGPADKAGLQAGDRIVSVDGSEVATQSDLGTLMQNHKAGDAIEITVARGGQMQTVSVTLGEKGAENN